MALGTLTPIIDQPTGATTPHVEGNLKVSVTNVVGDSSYPTGGSALTPAQLGLNVVLFAQTETIATTGTNCASTGSAYITGTSKLQCYANTGAEVANATNLSGITWQIIAWGY
jgi:hypothetical protein